jgi:hypothetical protein
MNIIATITGRGGERIGLGIAADDEGGYRILTERGEDAGGARWDAAPMARDAMTPLFAAPQYHFAWT